LENDRGTARPARGKPAQSRSGYGHAAFFIHTPQVVVENSVSGLFKAWQNSVVISSQMWLNPANRLMTPGPENFACAYIVDAINC
jgi:hypothetical protein